MVMVDKIISLSDTIGSTTHEIITYLFSNLIPAYPQIEFGAHLHTTPDSWQEKVHAAAQAGCVRFDGAIQGFGGCPMAKDRKSTRLNSSHVAISYAVFCLKKKKKV